MNTSVLKASVPSTNSRGAMGKRAACRALVQQRLLSPAESQHIKETLLSTSLSVQGLKQIYHKHTHAHAHDTARVLRSTASLTLF